MQQGASKKDGDIGNKRNKQSENTSITEENTIEDEATVNRQGDTSTT